MRALIAFSALLLLVPAPVSAQPTPPLQCASSKLKAAGKDADGNLKCYAKALKRNESVDGECLSKSRSKHDDAFAKAESKGGCETTGDADDVALLTDDFVADVIAAIPTGADDDSRKCASAKERAAGKEAKALATCAAKGAADNSSPDPACVTKARDNYDLGFAKAEAKGGCALTGDADAVELLVDAYLDQIRGALVPICGDNILGPGEACDGTSDAACPGECLSICVCAGDCGNGVAEPPGEECDDGDFDDGDGCSSLCQLEDPSAACAGISSTPGTELGAELISSDFDNPVFITAPPLDPRRLFVVEQPGVIRVVRDGVLLATPFMDINGLVKFAFGEEGLLSMAFDPDYENNKRFFVYYTNNAGNQVIARYEALTDDVADDTSEEILMTISHPTNSNHNGGQLQFDGDGLLYAGIGDGGGGGDPDETGQDDTEMRGKLLRMDVDTNTAPFWNPPPDNPDPDAPGDLASIWAKGLRNPWRFSFDRETDDMYLADVGQGSIEEIDYAEAPRAGGVNYGWDIFEGSDCFEPDPAPDCPDPPTGFTFPIFEYNHGQGCSVTGGYVYRGCAMPDVAGTYFYSDYCSGWIRTFEVVGGAPLNQDDKTAEMETNGYSAGNTTSFGEDARGEVYIATQDGSVWKIVPAN